jgi:hypothetical protein
MADEASSQRQDDAPQVQIQQQAPQPQLHPTLRDPGQSEDNSSDSSNVYSELGSIEDATSSTDSSGDNTAGKDRHWHEMDGVYDPSKHSDSSSLPVEVSGSTPQQSATQQHEPVRLFVAVISMAANRDRRDAVRATWGSDERCDCYPHLRVHELRLQNA